MYRSVSRQLKIVLKTDLNNEMVLKQLSVFFFPTLTESPAGASTTKLWSRASFRQGALQDVALLFAGKWNVFLENCIQRYCRYTWSLKAQKTNTNNHNNKKEKHYRIRNFS